MHPELVILILAYVTYSSAVRHQAVAIKGKLLCGAAPARNVRVKLWEEDTGQKIGCFANFLVNWNFINIKCTFFRARSR